MTKPVQYDRESTLAEYQQALSDCHRAIHAFERFGITAPPRYYRECEGIKTAIFELRRLSADAKYFTPAAYLEAVRSRVA